MAPLRRAHDEDGASAVEYGLLISGVAALIVAMVLLFGGMVSELFASTCDSIGNEASIAESC